ncbi:MAG: ImmA/IrrE family metallo-endopeptidase [Peptoanaerobacter stomatis]|uniref:ImmA/IrrE family metallo-endopeptidase n=1 Tax=Peptoanaerobacter stomatis TaxID=796937 RepID=UPI003F9F0AB6
MGVTKTLNRLYKYVDEQEIKLKYVNDLEYKYNLCGLYAHTEDTPVILLDSKLEKDTKKHISILAEECGHYATSYGNNINHVNNENSRVLLEKCEQRADKWKCSFIIPDDILKEKLLEFDSLLEVASDLCISVDIVLNRLNLSITSKPLILAYRRYINRPYQAT